LSKALCVEVDLVCSASWWIIASVLVCVIVFDPSGVRVCCCLLIRFSANAAEMPRAAGK